MPRAGFSTERGPAVVYSEGGTTSRLCKKPSSGRCCTLGRVVCGEGFYSVSPSLAVTQLSRPHYVVVGEGGECEMTREPHEHCSC